jgi:hypothetical protein
MPLTLKLNDNLTCTIIITLKIIIWIALPLQDNLKFDKVPAEPNLQQYDTNTVIPSKKYNSWMSEEDLAPDLSNTNRQTNK